MTGHQLARLKGRSRMPIMVVTRLRLKNPGVLDAFLAAAVAVLEQAKKSEGSLGADALAEANDTWWTVTAWADRPSMEAFVQAEPHRHHGPAGRLVR
jgi:heme-degrading monooxygenase HmoA